LQAQREHDLARGKKLIIVGAGDLAREVAWLASEIPEPARGWTVSGFLDDDPGAPARLRGLGCDVPVLGTIGQWKPQGDEVFVTAIGSPGAKLRAAKQLSDRGARFTSLVHPAAVVLPGASIGDGVAVFRNVSVSAGARIGDHVLLYWSCTIGHDANIGEGCTIHSHADVTGWVVLHAGAMLGSHAVVLQKLEVGAMAVVGAGAVVNRSVPAGATVVGVPARLLKAGGTP
jgi:sugar O-acyltransferase (sialic acid O-acetyltransferase NeuD family)